MWVFIFYKYDKFWSILLEQKVELKPLFFWGVCSFFSGSGNFSEVFAGKLREKTTSIRPSKIHEVAIKVLRNTGQSNFVEFYKEVAILVHLRHENVVEFLGISHDSNSICPSMMMIFKLMKGGQLLQYLRSNKEHLSLLDLFQMSLDVTKGCAYLERMKYVHRDLAARNCLLTSRDKSLRTVCK